MRALLLASILVFAGCLNGDYNGDASAAPPPDLSVNIPVFDLAGVDLFNTYNCSALNQCIQKCTTAACVFMCRNMATPTARALEDALEGCFKMYCPTGMGQVCAPDANGMLTSVCMMCLSNTYVPSGQSCQATQQVDECHQCVQQANACTADM